MGKNLPQGLAWTCKSNKGTVERGKTNLKEWQGSVESNKGPVEWVKTNLKDWHGRVESRAGRMIGAFTVCC